MGIRIERVSTLDPDQAERAAAWQAVFVDSAVAMFGEDHDVWSMASRRAREAAPTWDRRYVVALDDDNPNDEPVAVGGGELSMPLRDNPELAILDLAVLPEHRGRGIGTLLLEHLTDVARGTGRSSLVAETSHAPGVADAGESFLLKHGYAIAQANLRNDLDVAAYGIEGPRETPGYVIETSTDDTLEEWLTDRATLQRRMSTDAPVGDLDFEEEEWDADRLRGQRDATRASGRRAIESVARHVPTDALVAFTQLQVPMEHPVLAYQQDTLVLREHRGHGLGAAVKAASMRALAAEFPDVAIIRTWNAESNGPMIAVNEALGYRTTAHLREWQKRLG